MDTVINGNKHRFGETCYNLTGAKDILINLYIFITTCQYSTYGSHLKLTSHLQENPNDDANTHQAVNDENANVQCYINLVPFDQIMLCFGSMSLIWTQSLLIDDA